MINVFASDFLIFELFKGNHSFYKCSFLTILKCVTKFGINAFLRCSTLTKFTITNKLRRIFNFKLNYYIKLNCFINNFIIRFFHLIFCY